VHFAGLAAALAGCALRPHRLLMLCKLHGGAALVMQTAIHLLRVEFAKAEVKILYSGWLQDFAGFVAGLAFNSLNGN
jgi:hypothetical protein